MTNKLVSLTPIHKLIVRATNERIGNEIPPFTLPTIENKLLRDNYINKQHETYTHDSIKQGLDDLIACKVMSVTINHITQALQYELCINESHYDLIRNVRQALSLAVTALYGEPNDNFFTLFNKQHVFVEPTGFGFTNGMTSGIVIREIERLMDQVFPNLYYRGTLNLLRLALFKLEKGVPTQSSDVEVQRLSCRLRNPQHYYLIPPQHNIT